MVECSMSKKYLHSINWFRGVAIIFVVMTHLSTDGILQYDLGKYVQAFFQNGTSFFVFISGYLFWHLIGRFNYDEYLVSKIKNVVTPYLLLMTMTLLGVYVLSLFNIYSIDYSPYDYRVQFYDLIGESGFLWHYAIGGAINFPLWFIPMILVFFLASLPIKMISESKYFTIFLVIFIVFTLISDRGDIAPMQFIHYLGIYLFGIFCKKNEKHLYDNTKIIALMTLPLSIIFVYVKVNITTMLPLWLITDYGNTVNYGEVQKIFSILFFLSILMHLEKGGRKSVLLDFLAKYSFGIFFLHYYFLIMSSAIFNGLGYDATMLRCYNT
jgi:peptidoglycan/LPS O-acetylase OafA/YrhL